MHINLHSTIIAISTAIGQLMVTGLNSRVTSEFSVTCSTEKQEFLDFLVYCKDSKLGVSPKNMARRLHSVSSINFCFPVLKILQPEYIPK